MTMKFGRALRTKAALQADLATYATGPWFGLGTYERGDPASPDYTDDPLLGAVTDNNRDPTAPLQGMQKGDVQRTVPLALDELGLWLCAAFGMPASSGSAGSFVHVFKSGAEILPCLTVQDLIAVNPLGTDQLRHHRGVVVDGFTIQAVKENAYPRVVLDLLMRDHALATDWLAGDDAETPFSVQRPPAWGASVLWNDAAIGEAATANVSYKNNCDRWPGLDGTEFPVSIDPGIPTIGGGFRLRTVSDTYHTLAKNGGNPGKLSLVWKLPGATTTRLLQLDINKARLSNTGQPVTGAGEISADYTVRGEQGTTGNPAFTVTLKNAVETYALEEEEE